MKETRLAAVAIERIFVKHLEFDSPDTPQVFDLNWTPKLRFDINAGQEQLEEERYEVWLRLKVEAEVKKCTAFKLLLVQAGYFRIRGLEGEKLGRVLMVTCPDILFPYAREATQSAVQKASFPSLTLAPIDFDAIYRRVISQQKAQAARDDAEIVN